MIVRGLSITQACSSLERTMQYSNTLSFAAKVPYECGNVGQINAPYGDLQPIP